MTAGNDNRREGGLTGGAAGLFVRRPVLAIVLSILVVVAGAAAFGGVEVRELPNVDQPVITIRTNYTGATPETVDNVNGMPYRLLGSTGAKVSLLGVGGYHIGVQASAEESIRIIRTAIDEGVNFLDNAWEYNQGRSEERMGLALADGYRKKAFVMTKVCGRDAKTAATNIDDSLRRLKTDVIDLLQFHEINYDNDPDLIFAKEGAIHAVLKAKEAGKIRFIGFTGHKSPHIHLKMLGKDYPWDTAQMPLNVMDAHYRSFAQQVVPVLVQRKIGVDRN